MHTRLKPMVTPNSSQPFANRKYTRLSLSRKLGLAVGDLDTELLGAGNDLYPLLGGDGVGDPASLSVVCRWLCSKCRGRLLGSVGLVVHEEEVEVTDVVDEESLVAGGHHVAGLLVAAVADL